jgi:hypothetical protein
MAFGALLKSRSLASLSPAHRPYSPPPQTRLEPATFRLSKVGTVASPRNCLHISHVMRNRNVAFLMNLRQTSCCKRTSGIALCQVVCQVRRQKCQVSLKITVSRAPATAQFAQWRKGNISGISQLHLRCVWRRM